MLKKVKFYVIALSLAIGFATTAVFSLAFIFITSVALIQLVHFLVTGTY
jgi:hypothetical protein